jgi:hypothetical protein
MLHSRKQNPGALEASTPVHVAQSVFKTWPNPCPLLQGQPFLAEGPHATRVAGAEEQGQAPGSGRRVGYTGENQKGVH